MALTLTNRGTGTHNTGATSFTLSPGTNFAAGASGVLCVAADNSSSGGSTNDFTTVTDTLGNTWTKRQSPVFDNGAASAGVQGAIYTTEQDVGTLQTSTVITVNFGSSPVAKTWTLTEVAPASGKVARFRTGGNKSAGATGTGLTLGASVSVTVGEVIVACFYMEAGTTNSVTMPDQDTTNGTWATPGLQYAEIGTTASGSCIASQSKLQITANSTQTYDTTIGLSSDYHSSYVILTELTLYTLTASNGSVTETGTAATLKEGHLVSASAGAETITGTAATLKEAHILSASSGAEAITGTAATLKEGYIVPASSGAETTTGTAATLTYTPHVGYTLTADSGAETVTGTDASFPRTYLTSAASGAETITGTSATLKEGHLVSASSGAETITGTNANFSRTYLISAVSGAEAIIGTAATLKEGHRLSASAGATLVTGSAATLNETHQMVALPGAFSLTGTAASLNFGQSMVAGAGAFALTGIDAAFHSTYALSADIGATAVDGIVAALQRSRNFDVSAGTNVITGTDATLSHASGAFLHADPGDYSVAGIEVALSYGLRVVGAPAAILVTGHDVGFTHYFYGATRVILLDDFDMLATLADDEACAVILENP